MNTLDPRVVQLWRIQGLLRFFLFWMPVLGVGAAFLVARFGVLGWAIPGVTLGMGLIQTLVWPSLAWERFRYSVREHDVLVEQGVLFLHTVSVPLSRIQHVDTRQGPVERAFGLSRVVFYTAAGMAADASIPGLAEAEAEALRDQLSRRGGEGEGV